MRYKKVKPTPDMYGPLMKPLFTLVFILAFLFLILFNIFGFSTFKDYGAKQYFLNIWHFQMPCYYQVENVAEIYGYKEKKSLDKLDKQNAVVKLKKGMVFQLNGYERDGEISWLAAEAYKGTERLTFWLPVNEKWKRSIGDSHVKSETMAPFQKGTINKDLRAMVAEAWLKNIDFLIIQRTDKQMVADTRANEKYVKLPKPANMIGVFWNKFRDQNQNFWTGQEYYYFAPKNSKAMRNKIQRFYYSRKVRVMHATQLDSNFSTPKPEDFIGVPMPKSLQKRISARK